MDHLSDLLLNRKYDEPAEIGIIRRFVSERYQASAEVKVLPDRIVITVAGAALASSLRSDMVEIQQLCQTTKDIVIIIR